MNSSSNSPDAGPPERGRLALRFISGKYQGGEFPLSEGASVVVGRSSDLDMVLVEEMVSRKHARIEMRQGVVEIEDLGSTNGTFVNGERVERASLREGDRLLIGTSILKLVSLDQHQSASNLQRVAFGKSTVRHSGTSGAARMSGNLEEIPLPDLMQLFGTSRKSGVLVIHSADVGRFVLRDGLIEDASIDGISEMPPQKAAFRMLAWSQGTFALEPPREERAEQPLDLSAQEFLMEGFRQLDELNNLRRMLPAPDKRLTLKTPLEAPLHELEQGQLDVLQLAINSPSLQATLDRSPRSDLETAQAMLALIRKGYIEPVG